VGLEKALAWASLVGADIRVATNVLGWEIERTGANKYHFHNGNQRPVYPVDYSFSGQRRVKNIVIRFNA
jgi:hypothetical protein